MRLYVLDTIMNAYLVGGAQRDVFKSLGEFVILHNKLVSRSGAISATATSRPLFPKFRLYFPACTVKNRKMLVFITVIDKA